MGKADIWVDAVKVATVDLYRATTAYQQKVFSTGLLPVGSHTVRVTWYAGNARGRYINVDAVDVVGAPAN